MNMRDRTTGLDTLQSQRNVRTRTDEESMASPARSHSIYHLSDNDLQELRQTNTGTSARQLLDSATDGWVNIPTTTTGLITDGISTPLRTGTITGLATPVSNNNSMYLNNSNIGYTNATLSSTLNSNNNMQFRFNNDRSISIDSSGEVTLKLGSERKINLNDFIDRVEKLEMQMAALMELQQKKLGGKLLRSKINL